MKCKFCKDTGITAEVHSERGIEKIKCSHCNKSEKQAFKKAVRESNLLQWVENEILRFNTDEYLKNDVMNVAQQIIARVRSSEQKRVRELVKKMINSNKYWQTYETREPEFLVGAFERELLAELEGGKNDK